MEAEDVKSSRVLILARRRIVRHTEDKAITKHKERSFINLLIKKMQLDVNFGMLLSNMVMFLLFLLPAQHYSLMA